MITKAGIFKYLSCAVTLMSIVFYFYNFPVFDNLSQLYLITLTLNIVAIVLGVISLKEEKNLVAIISLLLIALFWGYFLSLYVLGWLIFGGK